MKPPRPGVRLVIAAGLLFAVFSFLATRAITSGHWPELPPGAFRDVDLWTGLTFLAALVFFFLLSKNRARPPSP